jgi:tetratricopeptide (TPR) repeat protein
MRAPETEATGTAGASEVAAEFQRLGWGATENARHDLGTDLFLAVRDERRFDLGLIVGAQVKAGPSYFAEPKHDDDGELEGWWYRDDDGEHVEAWLAHTLPHIVVLRDMEALFSYWGHVTADAVVSTGKGAKLLVSRTQVVSADQREALLEVAKSQRQSIPWEGSIWTAGSALTPHQLLRHALVVPRLVAPHPNADVGDGLTPEQAVAMLMQARLNELDNFAKEYQDVPALRDAGKSNDWRWRFARALSERLTTSRLDALNVAVDDAPSPWTRAAATVAAAAALTELARPEEALELVNAALDRDDAEPVDHAWLLMQRARASAEIGHLDEARADALNVVGIRNVAPHDATATAVAGAAANLLFDTSAWGSRDLEQAITGSDTAASWWRQQTTARGLGAIVDRTFKVWADDKAKTIGGTADANNQLFAASLLASHLGSQSGWRHLAGLTGCEMLMGLDRHADAEPARNGLDELRLAGATKELRLAATKLANDGPATAVTLALANVDLDLSTRTTAGADLVLLKTGGHLADEPTASRAANQLLALLDDPEHFFTRTTASTGFGHEIVEALAGITPATDVVCRYAIREHVLALDAIEDQLLATNYAQVIRALSRSTWDNDAAARAGKAADTHHSALALPLLGVAAVHDPAASQRLIALAHDGSLAAAAALGDVRKLPAHVAGVLTDQLAEAAQRVVADAHDGKYGIGTDVGSSLVRLNAWHPDSAKWEPLLELLADDCVCTSDKRSSLHFLALLADQVAPEVRDRLIPIATRIARREVPETNDVFGTPRGAAGEATNLICVLGGVDRYESAARLVDLLGGGPADRRWAARVAARTEDQEGLGLLVTLAADADPSVRAVAAQGLATVVATADAGPLAERALEACITDPGALVPAHTAHVLRAAGGQTAAALLAPLREHPSAYVRQAATGADS